MKRIFPLVLCAALVTEVTAAAPPTLQSVAVTPAFRTLPVAQKQRYTATGTFSDGSTQSLGAAIGDIAPASMTTCVLLSSGGADCWGSNEYGHLGDGSSVDSSVNPRPVKWLTTATAVANGALHACALLAGGTIKCWGDYGSGQLGAGDSYELPWYSRPIPVKGIRTATAMAAGEYHSCAVLANGAVRCWGYNWHGELGNGTKTEDERSPVRVTGISSATSLGLGDRHSCAVLVSGAVHCWGSNEQGQLGSGTAADSYVPATVKGLGNATAVAAGFAFNCALLASGEVKCWGAGGEGQLGNGAFADSRVPVPVSGISTAVAITAGAYHACAVLSSGSVQCWGSNNSGELGDGSTTGSNVPVRVGDISSPVRLAAGNGYTCALLSDGAMRCWGRDDYGQLGDRRMINPGYLPTPSPVNVIGTPGVVWRSSDPAKATITMRGLATAHAAGNATITATTAGFIDDNVVLTVR